MYDPGWVGPHLIWPPYHAAAQANGILTDDQARQVRACYGGKLTMIDTWFGKLMDAVERNGLASDTAIVVCTDHGHYLGEKDIWGKPGVPVYEPLGHIPLMVAWPGRAPADVEALTTSVDLHATLCDLFGVVPDHTTHGASLVPILAGEADSVREYLLAGVWGREVHLIDKRFKYARAPEGPNAPLSVWSNRWSTMPAGPQHLRMPRPDSRAWLDRMPGSTVPVIRQPFQAGDMLPYWAYGKFSGNHVYDLWNDPAEDENRSGERVERELADKLRQALQRIQAPGDQFARLGL
jgi:arylsulfatase A-like enzyme